MTPTENLLALSIFMNLITSGITWLMLAMKFKDAKGEVSE